KYILLLVDSYSKWLEAFITTNKTSATTLTHLQETMARFGIPKIDVTDNDPTFASAQFDHFCVTNGIRHMTSPPYHPASNGQVERYVNTLKTALEKLSSEGKDLNTSLSLFLFRQYMMSSAAGESPACRMLGRELRSKLDLLKEQPSEHTFTDSPKFMVGETVMARNYQTSGPKWFPGRIARNCGSRICETKALKETKVIVILAQHKLTLEKLVVIRKFQSLSHLNDLNGVQRLYPLEDI
ncbi:uncharacterized protein K02A2.6-like, partial [Galendromus occidentalis]|uniref:Uncharacterized protein K02A2.6-like n=1 Tax=Galendromus occidentalis TaxID=34638 RepID=A0AAJ7SJL8_9ACAR